MESKLTLNGKHMDVCKLLENETTIPNIMKYLDLKKGQVAIKINDQHIRMKDFETYNVNPNDKIEIITLIAGG